MAAKRRPGRGASAGSAAPPGAIEPPSRIACPACGFTDNPGEFRFCGRCGAGLTVSHAERRQLTVLFCDLVASTELAERLDPEVLRDLMGSYRAICELVFVEHHKGYIARFVGDGVLVYFGFPHAHEDDAQRAARAGLEIARAVAGLRVPGASEERPLAVRVGIATGVVIAGDLIGSGASREAPVVGGTPNLAARLTALAAPNTVVVAPATRALLGEHFDCADTGVHTVKGLPQPVRAWCVIAPRDDARRHRLLPLIDREKYTGWLRDLWHEAEAGEGRVALLYGAAGIGKSRIVAALREKVAATPYAPLRFQCSPHYRHTALHPIIEHIQRGAEIGREATEREKLHRLIGWAGRLPDADRAIPLLALLLGIPAGPELRIEPMSADLQKQRTFEVIIDHIRSLADAWPLPIVFEDVHWIDPTTLEFLGQLIARVRTMRALLVITYRPEDFTPPRAWKQPHVKRKLITELARKDAVGLAQTVAGTDLPSDLVDAVVKNAEGVPLFVEELTRDVLDMRLGPGPAGSRSVWEAQLQSIPARLQDSLNARLDRLGQAKGIAQLAASIGREFSYALLEAVAELSPERLSEALQVLERAGLIYREPGLGAEAYAFRHALVQKAAYDTLLLERRRAFHARIASALENRFPGTAREAPELVAHHWTEAREPERAVSAWLAAGKRAALRSEYQEAIAHLRRGLWHSRKIAERELRRDLELELRLTLGPALITTQGANTRQATRMYKKALALCEGRPASRPRFVAQWGWWRVSMNHSAGRARADRLVELANSLEDPALLLQAHHCQWATLYMLGSHRDCCGHIEEGRKLYDPTRERIHAGSFGGHDALVCAHGEQGLALWMLGEPQEALTSADSAVRWSEELNHVGSRAHAMDYTLVLRKFRRDLPAVEEQAARLHKYASEQKLAVHKARGEFFHGWARALSGDVAAGLQDMLTALASKRVADTPHDFTLYYEMMAEIYAKAGLPDEALAVIRKGLEIADAHGIFFWNPELYRRRGEVLRAVGDRAGAAEAFEAALKFARKHGAKSLELRAAVSLGRLRAEQGRREEALSAVQPIYAEFGGRFDTADVVEARELMETLS